MLKAKQLACVSESGQKCPAARSLSLRRAWIEITHRRGPCAQRTCRSPYGERGLKLIFPACSASHACRSPYGERGLKLTPMEQDHPDMCRSPYGERGLKYQGGIPPVEGSLSLSLRRAWIEIGSGTKRSAHATSLSLRRAWIEIMQTMLCIVLPYCRSPYGERGLK